MPPRGEHHLRRPGSEGRADALAGLDDRLATRPKVCSDDGLPTWRETSSRASTAAGSMGVVAAWSRWWVTTGDSTFRAGQRPPRPHGIPGGRVRRCAVARNPCQRCGRAADADPYRCALLLRWCAAATTHHREERSATQSLTFIRSKDSHRRSCCAPPSPATRHQHLRQAQPPGIRHPPRLPGTPKATDSGRASSSARAADRLVSGGFVVSALALLDLGRGLGQH